MDDGPGLRTVIFLQGCPLACPWCHNPEGRSPTGGQRVDLPWLLDQALADQDFHAGTGGGVTFSGGEPMAQPQFLLACARELKRREVHVALETAGFWDSEYVAALAKLFDLVLFDLKHTDGERFREATGQPPDQVLSNLRALHEAGLNLELRLTLIPGFNDARSDLREIAAWLRKHDIGAPITVQPFHRMAAAKQERWGKNYPYANVPPVTRQQVEQAEKVLRE